MSKTYILYNPLAGNGHCGASAKAPEVAATVAASDVTYWDMTQPEVYTTWIPSLQPDDTLVICGGDGTLNRFANAVDAATVPCDVLYCPMGSGNDFSHDMGYSQGDKPFSIKKYLQNLPVVTVNGNTYKFINGIGYGIDGYCCEVGDKLRQTPGKKVDYTAIAIKGLLFHYNPTSAKVTVDGKTQSFKKVWLAPTMNGRFYGGGMMPTPNQKRNGGELSVMVMHGSGKLHTLMVFPSIFKGEHVKHKKIVSVLTGKEITVEFDRPTALQIDGETILGVTKYTAKV